MLKDAWCSAVWARAHARWQMSMHRSYLAGGDHPAWSAQQAGRLCVCAEGVPTGDAPKQGEQVSDARDAEWQALRRTQQVIKIVLVLTGTAFSAGASRL